MSVLKCVIAKPMSAIVLFGSLIAAQAVHAEDRTILAKVLNSTPITETVQTAVPRRVCRDEQVVTQHTKSYTPSIIGGIVGAVVGSRFGGGKGKDLATIAGGVAGASVGNDVENRKLRGHTAVVERCHDEPDYDYQDRVTGWRVTYEYNGETFVTRTDRDPGKTIPIHVQFQPEG